MTIIAWDGKTLAADKRTSYASTIATTTKIERMPDGALVGSAGNTSRCKAMHEWFRTNRQPEKFPTFQTSMDTNVDILCIEPDGRIHVYQLTPYPTLIEDEFFSFGSGSNYALAALYLGYSAQRAVEVANALDSTCGNGVDTLTLEVCGCGACTPKMRHWSSCAVHNSPASPAGPCDCGAPAASGS